MDGVTRDLYCAPMTSEWALIGLDEMLAILNSVRGHAVDLSEIALVSGSTGCCHCAEV